MASGAWHSMSKLRHDHRVRLRRARQFHRGLCCATYGCAAGHHRRNRLRAGLRRVVDGLSISKIARSSYEQMVFQRGDHFIFRGVVVEVRLHAGRDDMKRGISYRRFMRAQIALCGVIALGFISSCQVVGIASAIGQNIEREKKIEVLAKYAGLDNKRVAILVKADMGTVYEHPTAVPNISFNLAQRLQENVPGIKMLDPRVCMNFQHQTPNWSAQPLGQVAEELDVDRLVILDLYEYRLNPPGNRYLWEGVAAGNIGVAERDGLDSDQTVDQWNVSAQFPLDMGVTREAMNMTMVQRGLLTTFVRNAAWVFYDHIEEKYPDVKK